MEYLFRRRVCLAAASLFIIILFSFSVLSDTFTTRVTINRTSVSVNATYNTTFHIGQSTQDYVELMPGYPRISGPDGLLNLQTVRIAPSSEPFRADNTPISYTFLSTADLPTSGDYLYEILVKNKNNLTRPDSRNFTVVVPPPPGCGDGALNTSTGEECDEGSNNGAATASCTLYCKRKICNNSRLDDGEDCDGNLFGGMTCVSLGFRGGTLGCDRTCHYATDRCFNDVNFCGNQRIDSGEACDLSVFATGSSECRSVSDEFTSGRATCTAQCMINTSSCIGNRNGTCGDGIVAVGENCDGSLEKTCADLGFDGGSLRCTGCLFDTRDCYYDPNKPDCGDGIIQPGESCDGSIFLQGITDCRSVPNANFTGGILRCYARSRDLACKLDTTSCTGLPAGRCGDGRIQVGEDCEGSSVNATCQVLGFDSGTARCTQCHIDTSNCRYDSSQIRKCGNNLIDPGEECDGESWGPIEDCSDYPGNVFTGGQLSCSNTTCRFITTECEGPRGGRCGDTIVQSGEECDGSVRAKCSDFDRFFGSSIRCTNCLYDTSSCQKPSAICGDSEVNPSLNESCDKLNLNGMICSSFPSLVGGTLKCDANCHFDKSGCTAKTSTTNSSCQNKIKDPNESDIDCGGLCPACDIGKSCSKASDCRSNYCDKGFCRATSCSDKIKNGLESDVDCGGDCPPCALNSFCSKNSDCTTNFCNGGKCVDASCDDGVMNGQESDIDCGGKCNKCAIGSNCYSAADCSSGNCDGGICSIDKSLDSDGDGMPDWWEDKYNLDRDDSSDADQDADDDGYSNLEEYLMMTNPIDHADPGAKKSHVLPIVLLIIGLLLIGGSTGFLVYSRKVLIPLQRRQAQMARAATAQQRMQAASQSKTGFQQPKTAPGGKLSLKAQLLKRIADKKKMQQGGAAAGGAKQQTLQAQGQLQASSVQPAAAKKDAGSKPGSPPKSEAFEKLNSLNSLANKREQKDTAEALKELGASAKKKPGNLDESKKN